MKLCTLDYETYYSKEYSLSKLSTEDYVNDPQFEVIGVGLKIGNSDAQWFTGPMSQVKEFLWDHSVHRHALLCQNTMFDQLINQVHFNIYPPLLLDTMCMSQALLKPYIRSVGLASVLKFVGLGAKGGYLQQAIGRRRTDFDDNDMRQFRDYCLGDVNGTYKLFQYLVKQLPRKELEIIDMTLRMYLEPQLELDAPLLGNILEEVRSSKAAMMAKLPDEIQRSDLMSNPKFAELLQQLGVDPPVKISPTTGRQTWAFSKTDEAWKDLEEEYADDPIVGPLLAARIGVKSTIAETRAERLLAIAQRYKKFRIPLRYYAAHTGRYGGMQKINPQNFTRINLKKKKNPRNQLRYAIRAPKHHVVLAADLKQIEARMNAWVANQPKLLTAFRNDLDVYSEFASQVFGRPITKKNEKERFIGKTCILGLGYGMGWEKLRATLRKDGIKLTEAEASHYVHTYRSLYPEIPSLWKECNDLLQTMAAGNSKRRIGPCVAYKDIIQLPNGMPLTYNNLRHVQERSYSGWVYDFGGATKTLWGGKVVENIIQSLARIVISENMLRVKKELGIPLAMQAHDELVYVPLERNADDTKSRILEIMGTPPDWAAGLPVAGEVDVGPTYGDAK